MTEELPTPSITGEKVYLRPMEKKDFSDYIRSSHDLDLGYVGGFFIPRSSLQMEKALETRVTEEYGKTGYWFTICELGTHENVGFITFFHLDLVHGSAELGIFLSKKEVKGKGFGSDAIKALLDFGFGRLPLERIYLHVNEDNAIAIRAYEKVGFVREGTLRNSTRKGGKMINDYLMSVLRGEWLDRKM